MVGGDDVAVVASIPLANAGCAAPDAGVRIESHIQVGVEHQRPVGAGVVQAQFYILRRRRPHGGGDFAVGVDRAERRLVRVLAAGGVDVVQHAGQLQLRAELVAGGVFADDPQLLREQFLHARDGQIQCVCRIRRQMRHAHRLCVAQGDGSERCRQFSADHHASGGAVVLLFGGDFQCAVGGAVELHVGELPIPQDGAGIDPVRRLILHGQRRRFELRAHVVDAQRFGGGAGFPKLVLGQGGVHHHPVHVAVGIGGVFAEVDAQIDRLRRTALGVDDEVAADAVLLQLQHPVGAVDRVDAAVQVVLVVRRRAVRPAGAAALVAVVHGAVRPAQGDPFGIPAASLAAVVPQVQHPAAEVLIAPVVVHDRFVRPRHVFRRRLVRHDAAPAHGHFGRLALRHRRRPALAVVQNHLIPRTGGERRLIPARPAAASRQQDAGEDEGRSPGRNRGEAAHAGGVGESAHLLHSARRVRRV